MRQVAEAPTEVEGGGGLGGALFSRGMGGTVECRNGYVRNEGGFDGLILMVWP